MIKAGELPRINSERATINESRTAVLFCQLRSTGIDIQRIKQAFDDYLFAHPDITSIHEQEIVEISNGRMRLTEKGYRYCDAIVVRLMEPEVTVSLPIHHERLEAHSPLQYHEYT